MHKHPSPSKDQLVSLDVNGLGSSGEGVGNLDGFTLFVDGALPGEVVQAKIIERKKTYGVAKLLSISKPSPDRISPICPLFGRCGGCQIMHLSYPKQLEMKRQKVIDAIFRIGKLRESPTVENCLPSPLPLAYRNKIQLPVRQGKDSISIGLYAKASHELIEVDRCYIHCELGENVFEKIKPLIKDSKILPFEPKTGEGELRHILIKSAVKTGQVLVIFVTNQAKSPKLLSLAKEVITRCSSVQGVIHNIQSKNDNVILGRSFEALFGKSFIEDTICGLTFRVSPASFFQVNPQQAEKLYLKALEFADIQPEETVLDAYCGVGTLSLIFAGKAKEVIGVEYVADAIRDAKINAKINDISNVRFICAPAEKHIHALKKIDTLLLNPPRKGCDPSFLEGIKKLKPKKIVYISCDPATLARDLSILEGFGYRTKCIQPFDMFPQTSHVECVAKLCLEENPEFSL